MTLGFMQKFPWRIPDTKEFEPTHFREKILAGVGYVHVKELDGSFKRIRSSGTGLTKVVIDNNIPKLHTLREDSLNRWKAGRKIEMVYRGAGYKILDHFNKGIPELEKCVSVQKIEIKWASYTGFTSNTSSIGYKLIIMVDKKRIEPEVMSVNDGFNSVNDFCRWFKSDWEGKCIHWTDLRY